MINQLFQKRFPTSRKTTLYLLTGVIFLISFFFLSSLFYPALNSDNAVSILMIHYFKLPHDLYFWGQDRMGSLIPLLAQIPFRIFKVSAITSEAIIHYSILLAGFAAFSFFIKSYSLKLIFAIVWFLPPMRMIDTTQFAFGIAYSLSGIACYFLYKAEKNRSGGIRRNLFLTGSIITLILAVWVLDLAIITAFIIAGIFLLFSDKKSKLSVLIYFIAGIVAGSLFIYFAKSVMNIHEDYSKIAGFETISKSLGIFFNSIFKILTFRAREPITGIYSYLCLIILILPLFFYRKLKLRGWNKKILLIFLFDAIIVFCAIMIMEWTYTVNVPRRYFTCTYLSLSFSLILFFDNLRLNRNHRKYINIFLIITALTGAASTFYNLKYEWPKTLTPVTSKVNELKVLGKVGVIGSYWDSYILACVDPEKIVATPHDTTWAVRNYDLVEEVFKQQNIYLVRDGWMESFPDTVTQFDQKLVKCANELRLGGCYMCRYRKIGL